MAKVRNRIAEITLVSNSFDLNYFANFDGPFEDPDNDVIDND